MDIVGPIDLDCPECGARLRVTMADIANQRTKQCSRGHAVRLEDEGHGARDIEKSTRELEKSLKKLGGTVKIKF